MTKSYVLAMLCLEMWLQNDFNQLVEITILAYSLFKLLKMQHNNVMLSDVASNCLHKAIWNHNFSKRGNTTMLCLVMWLQTVCIKRVEIAILAISSLNCYRGNTTMLCLVLWLQTAFIKRVEITILAISSLKC